MMQMVLGDATGEEISELPVIPTETGVWQQGMEAKICAWVILDRDLERVLTQHVTAQ